MFQLSNKHGDHHFSFADSNFKWTLNMDKLWKYEYYNFTHFAENFRWCFVRTTEQQENTLLIYFYLIWNLNNREIFLIIHKHYNE